MNKVINSFCNTGEKIKSEICGGVSNFIFLYAEKIKSEIFVPFGHCSFELKKLSYVIFYARCNGVNEIFIFATVFEIQSLQRRYFILYYFRLKCQSAKVFIQVITTIVCTK